MHPNLLLGLYKLPGNPKKGSALFEISLIMLHKTAGTTQRASSLQPLPYEAEAKKKKKKLSRNFQKFSRVRGR